MKVFKIIMTTALSLMAMQSFAQSPLESLRKMFSESSVELDCSYETKLRNMQVTADYNLIVQGEMYKLIGNGLEVYCNGKAVWTIDESSSEVVIESCAGTEKDYMANPALMLAELDKIFKVASVKAMDAGKEEYVLDASVDCGVTKACVVLTSDGRILEGVFTLDDGNTLDFDVLSMKKTEEKPASFFSPDRKFGSDWIVTDLR